MAFATQPIQVIEIVQPLCSRVFGVSPCNATGDKCWNTDATCKFRSALNLTASLALRFVPMGSYEWRTEAGAFQPATAIPTLMGYQTAPTVLNVASGSRNKGPLGLRAVCSVKLKDSPSNDVETDPYVADRSYDPATQGSFWSKWLSRNPFHVGYVLRIYEGNLGDTLAEMIKREYLIEKIDAGRDGVSITAKDALRKVTDTGITAPLLSPGALAADIDASVTTLDVAGAVVADYPATGWVRIGSELIQYTGRSLVDSNVRITGLTRAALNTEAASHKQNGRVQTVVAYVAEPFSDILYDLLVTRGGIDAAYVDASAWDAEYTLWRSAYQFTAYITEPTKIDDLAGEVCLQAMANVWWDERVQKIILKAQRPDFAPSTLTDEGHILAGSFAIKEKPEERASQVFVYYGLRSPIASITDKGSYERAQVAIDVDKQGQYGGEPAIRELFCRFIQTDAIAASTASTYLQRFKDVRREATMEISAPQAGTYWTGDSVNVEHFLDVKFDGSKREGNWLITSAHSSAPGSRYAYTMEDNGSIGVLWLWQESDITPFVDATEQQKREIGYWLDDDGNDGLDVPRPFRWL